MLSVDFPFHLSLYKSTFHLILLFLFQPYFFFRRLILPSLFHSIVQCQLIVRTAALVVFELIPRLTECTFLGTCENCSTTAEEHFESGEYYYQRRNYRCAHYHFSEAVHKYQDRDSKICVGIMYEKGLEVSQDYREAAEMYYSAGYQGAQDAQFRLGLFFYEGRNGFAKDYMEAFRYFQKAADTSMSMPTHK